MVLFGETIGSLHGYGTVIAVTCDECGARVEPSVCQSNAGYYVGYWCCGPMTRESGYYKHEAEAHAALAAWTWGR